MATEERTFLLSVSKKSLDGERWVIVFVVVVVIPVSLLQKSLDGKRWDAVIIVVVVVFVISVREIIRWR